MGHGAAQAIGLVPGVELSPREMALVYRRLAEAHPEILTALKGTVTEGTLKGALGSAWFARHGFRLKTGTVRDLGERPRLGWIAVVSDAWIAVYTKRAVAPSEMLVLRRAVDTLFRSEGDPTLGKVIGGHFNSDPVSRQNADAVFTHATRSMSQDNVFII